MSFSEIRLNPTLLDKLKAKIPTLWINKDPEKYLPENAPSIGAIKTAKNRLKRSEQLLLSLFPQSLTASKGEIESELIPISKLQDFIHNKYSCQTFAHEAWFLKADHTLPVAGSVKARGGFHEVLAVAEEIAISNQLLQPGSDLLPLASEKARQLFSQYSITVGSTGNLGLSIGTLAAALGFSTTVQMSTDAKAWKKDRLRKRGVNVVEHSGDYAAAVDAGREEAKKDSKVHFVDDEQSLLLFLGYAASALYLSEQLEKLNRKVDKNHPLFVYIPCGVGGAPGGITYGLKALFGENVHCFFAEPTASPCMLVQLAAGTDKPISVYDIGLDNKTESDGLAVGQASLLVSPLMQSQLSGVFTVDDEKMFENLHTMYKTEQIFLEPSAATGLHGPICIKNSEEGQQYTKNKQIEFSNATHIIWGTGGSLVPEEEVKHFLERARIACKNNEKINDGRNKI